MAPRMIELAKTSNGLHLQKMTDRDLLRAYAKTGDADTLSVFLGRYQDSLVRFIERLVGDPRAAQESVQETFLHVARHPRQLLRERSCHNGLLRAARKAGLARLRRLKAKRRHYLPMGGVLTEIERLAPAHREVVLLKIQEGKTYREIAEITGLPVTNVGYLLHTAMKQLSTRLIKSREPE